MLDSSMACVCPPLFLEENPARKIVPEGVRVFVLVTLIILITVDYNILLYVLHYYFDFSILYNYLDYNIR